MTGYINYFLRISVLMTLILSFSIFAFASSHESRIIKAMNSGDWFALDSVYTQAPKDSIDSFIDVYARCLIGNRLNRPEMSIPAFEELIQKYSQQFDPDNLIEMAMMYSMDLRPRLINF